MKALLALALAFASASVAHAEIIDSTVDPTTLSEAALVECAQQASATDTEIQRLIEAIRKNNEGLSRPLEGVRSPDVLLEDPITKREREKREAVERAACRADRKCRWRR